MVDITRIKDLPNNTTPSASQYVATDLAATQKVTIQQLVDTGVPVASQAEAEAGSDASKRMTPLTTKQAIDAQIGPTITKVDTFPDYTDGTLGLSASRKYIDNVLSGAVYTSSGSTLPGDSPNYFVVRYANHTTAITDGVPRSFGALTQVLSDVKNFEYAGESSIEEKAPQTVRQEFVGFKSSAIRFASAAGTQAAMWAGYDECRDDTLLKSSLSGAEMRGREITMVASGADDSSIRYGLDVVHAKSTAYSGVDTQFAVGVRVVNASFYGSSFGRTTVGAAFDAHGDDPFATGSGIQIGFRSFTSSVGMLIDGNPANGSIIAEIFGSKSIMKLGMKAVNSSAGEIQFTSQNNAGAQKTAIRIDGGLLVSTTGSETGRISISALVNGVEREVLSYFPSDPVNPWSLIFDGVLRKIVRNPTTTALTAV